jgi:hypothetical protein
MVWAGDGGTFDGKINTCPKQQASRWNQTFFPPRPTGGVKTSIAQPGGLQRARHPPAHTPLMSTHLATTTTTIITAKRQYTSSNFLVGGWIVNVTSN